MPVVVDSLNEPLFELLHAQIVRVFRTLHDGNDDKASELREKSAAGREKDGEGESLTTGGEGSRRKLVALGRSVGYRIAERLARQRSQRMPEDLDVVKFLCREFWTLLFRKPIDNLKTNHKGTFVLQDNAFRWIARYRNASNSTSSTMNNGTLKRTTGNGSGGAAGDLGAEEQQVTASELVHFPCGLIEGALRAFGKSAHVSCELASPGSAVVFTLRIAPPTASVVQSHVINVMGGAGALAPNAAGGMQHKASSRGSFMVSAQSEPQPADAQSALS
eukprot:ANDGO_03590.mRNA.1 Uncharacterized protein C13G6.05c